MGPLHPPWGSGVLREEGEERRVLAGLFSTRSSGFLAKSLCLLLHSLPCQAPEGRLDPGHPASFLDGCAPAWADGLGAWRLPFLLALHSLHLI